MGETVRKNPCPSCPYRREVPSGIWDATEYQRLLDYDGDTASQNAAAFNCHQGSGELCAGWVGHVEDPRDLLAIRMGVIFGDMDPSVLDYTTDVPLFRSGAEAAAHGMREIDQPGPKARDAISKISRVRGWDQ